jgi:hypothetical protein
VQKVSRSSPTWRYDKTKRLTLDINATSHGNVHWMVPRTVNPLFTGRGELLRRIQKAIHNDHISPSDTQKRFVITGLGGQGKSEICLQVASQMREEYVLSIPSMVFGVILADRLDSGEYSGSTSARPLQLRATLSLLQSCLDGQPRVFPMLFKFLQRLSKAGSLSLITPMIRILITKSIFHPELTAQFS